MILTHLLSLNESSLSVSGGLVSSLPLLEDRLWDRDGIEDGTKSLATSY